MRGKKAKKERKEVRKLLITSKQLAEKVYEEFKLSVNELNFWGRLKLCLRILRRKL